jgi:hypothetical protein
MSAVFVHAWVSLAVRFVPALYRMHEYVWHAIADRFDRVCSSELILQM